MERVFRGLGGGMGRQETVLNLKKSKQILVSLKVMKHQADMQKMHNDAIHCTCANINPLNNIQA